MGITLGAIESENGVDTRRPLVQTKGCQKLLFILVYFRLYPTQTVQGYLFGMGQAQANEWVDRLSRVLNQALGKEQQLPEREPAKLEAVLSACPSLELDLLRNWVGAPAARGLQP